LPASDNRLRYKCWNLGFSFTSHEQNPSPPPSYRFLPFPLQQHPSLPPSLLASPIHYMHGTPTLHYMHSALVPHLPLYCMHDTPPSSPPLSSPAVHIGAARFDRDPPSLARWRSSLPLRLGRRRRQIRLGVI
jgi:hypothetical protein